MNGMTYGELGCALLGPGKFGRELAQALQEDVRVRFAGVLGATPQESAAGAAELGGQAYASLDALLRDDTVQAVLIATPSDTHAELAIAAARAGKQIFCEKPMALTVAECDAMIAAARASGVALQIGQMQRLVPLLAEVGRLLQAGTIGRPVSLLMQRHDLLQRQPGSWLQRRAQVGGVLHQSSVHELDWLRTLLGEVGEVFARAAPATIQEGLDFPDAIELSMRFQNGCIATLSACMTSYVWQHEGAVQGTEGSLAFSLSAGTLRWRDKQGRGESIQRDDFVLGAGAGIAIRAELRAFVDAALGLATPLIPGEEGRANLEVIQAALISIAEGRPIALPLPESQWGRRAHLELVSRTDV
jgi:myo-inositol 2-dehydrogenase / D-chiro-inositol 1-dehydrogenase